MLAVTLGPVAQTRRALAVVGLDVPPGLFSLSDGGGEQWHGDRLADVRPVIHG